MMSLERRSSSFNFMSRSNHEPSSSSDWRSLKASGVYTIKKESDGMAKKEPLEEEELQTTSISLPSSPKDPLMEDESLRHVSISPSPLEEYAIEKESHEDDEEKDSNKKDAKHNELSSIEFTDV